MILFLAKVNNRNCIIIVSSISLKKNVDPSFNNENNQNKLRLGISYNDFKL